MPPKRAHTASDTPDRTPSSPAKKRQILPPSTPFSTISASASSSRTTYATPADSPRNPFGRRRHLVSIPTPLKLPPISSFSRHLALHFQLHAPGLNEEGAWRIVQVPLSYSFKHLHKLIIFLFSEGDALRRNGVERKQQYSEESGDDASEERPSPRKLRSSKRKRQVDTSLKGKGKKSAASLSDVLGSSLFVDTTPAQAKDKGHIFLVRKDVVMCPTSPTAKLRIKPGDKRHFIRTGTTVVKLSSVRDPYRHGRDVSSDSGSDSDAEQANLPVVVDGASTSCDATVGLERHSSTSTVVNDIDDDEEGEWRWEPEEDFTLADAWPEGGSLSRGITYVHSSTSGIRIDITCNRAPLPVRKGTGNKPFVFAAHACVDLPLPESAANQLAQARKGRAVGIDALPLTAAASHPSLATNAGSSKPNGTSKLVKVNNSIPNMGSQTHREKEMARILNAPDAFETFLQRFKWPWPTPRTGSASSSAAMSSPLASPVSGRRYPRQRQQSQSDGNDDEGAPGSEADEVPLGSDMRTSPAFTLDGSSSPEKVYSTSFSDPFLPYTPFPARAHTRKRIDSARARLRRLSRESLGASVDSDEEEDDGDGDEANKSSADKRQNDHESGDDIGDSGGHDEEKQPRSMKKKRSAVFDDEQEV